jgi:hypothetical protein
LVNARKIVGEILGLVTIFEIGVLEMFDETRVIKHCSNVAIIVTSRRTLLSSSPVKSRPAYHQPGSLRSVCNPEWNKQ